MILQLLLPDLDAELLEAFIERWHKQEGEWVDYGDDLLDLRYVLTRHMLDAGPMEKGIALLKDIENASGSNIQGFTSTRELVMSIRLTASDAGCLSKIVVASGSRVAGGDLLAVLSTDDEAAVTVSSETLTGASEFRVITNSREWGEE